MATVTLTAGDLVAGTGHVLAIRTEDGIDLITVGPIEEGATPLELTVDPANPLDVLDYRQAQADGTPVRWTATAAVDDVILLDRLEDARTVASTRSPDVTPPAPLEGPAADLCPRCHHPYGRLPLVVDRELGARVHRQCPAVPSPLEVAAGASPEAAALAAELEELRPQPSPRTSTEPSPPPPRPAIAPAGRRGPRVEELKPWVAYYPDGTVNLGSYAYTAAVATVELATRTILERNRQLAAAAGTDVEQPSRAVVTFLARTLLHAADRVQAAIRPDGQVDRMDNSHTRARGAIRDALDLYPVPFGVTDEQRAGWLEAVVEHATMLLEVALAVVEVDR